MSYFFIIGLCNIAIGSGMLIEKKERVSKIAKILGYVNIALGVFLIGLAFFHS